MIFDHTRGNDPKLAGLFQSLPVGICGIVRAEVLHGTRNPAHRIALVALLNQFAHIPVPDTIWDDVGDNLAILRTHGLTLPFADAILATVAILGGHEIWTRDAHFRLAQQWLPSLRLFVEPP